MLIIYVWKEASILSTGIMQSETKLIFLLCISCTNSKAISSCQDNPYKIGDQRAMHTLTYNHYDNMTWVNPPPPPLRGQRPVEMGVIMQSRGHLLLLPPIPIVCIAPIQIFFNIQFLFSFSSYCPDITDNGLCLAVVRDLFLRTNFLGRNLFEQYLCEYIKWQLLQCLHP